MSIAAIMQPTYLPWIGYFDLIDQVEKFVFLDDVKVSKQSWGVRNRVNTNQGAIYISIPLLDYRDHVNRLFINTQIDYKQKWQKKHLKTLAQAYSKTHYFKVVYEDFEKLLTIKYATIADLNISIIKMVAAKIGIQTEFFRSSKIPDLSGHKDDRLVSICQALGVDQYLSPQGSAVYIESEHPGGAFPDSGIELFYHNFDHPEYPQRGEAFQSHMCIVDLLMNCGYDQALEIIRSGRREPIYYKKFREAYCQACRNP